MATRIRLRRMGRKKQPEYRIVVAEKTDARDGRFIETIGHYRPREDPAVIHVDGDRARAWLAKGATPSETVDSLFKKAGVYAASPAPGAEAPAPAVATDPPTV
ncbi:MAG: 30S ribosomal protein S16 [Gemmatimonadota bacterium]|nr:30S ribosomal protein S16 [Gemmatimonadota bacterium]